MIACRFRLFFSLTAASLAVIGVAACSKVPLLAPTQSTITLFAGASTIPVNGTVDIIATVLEQAGTPVQNGTLVTFTTTLGSIDPREARTNSGKVSVRLTAGNQSGTATVGALSGGATAKTIDIKVGNIAVGSLLFSVAPGSNANVPSSGGTVVLVAVVSDTAGNRLPGVPVTFTANAGTLTTNSASTDGSGEARTSITTNRETEVTATVGTGGKDGPVAPVAKVVIKVNVPPQITINSTTTNPMEGQSVAFQVTTTVAAGQSTVRSVTVDFGDGSNQDLGNLTGSTTVNHRYTVPGTYTVRATVVDSAGERSQSSTSVVIAAIVPTPVSVSLTAAPTSPKANTDVVVFTVNVTPTTVVVLSTNWTFGDGTTRNTDGGTTTHLYTHPGAKQITAVVSLSDGSSRRVQTEVNVLPQTLAAR